MMSSSLFVRSMRPLFLLLAGVILFSCSNDDAGTDSGKPAIVSLESKGITLSAEAGSAQIHYTVSNPAESAVVTAECPDSWIELEPEAETGVIRFRYAMNPEAGSRTAAIRLHYPGAESLSINVTQLGSDKWMLDVSVTDVEAFQAVIQVNSSEPDPTYVMLNLTRADFERFATDGELTAYYIDLFRTVASSYGITLEALLEQLFYTGNIREEIDNLIPQTDYVAIAFGLNADATVTSEVFSMAYTTPAPPYYEKGVDFEVRTLKPNYMDVELLPGSNEYRYYADVLTKSEFEAFPSLEEFADIVIGELKDVIDMNNAFGNPITWDDITYQNNNSFSVNTLYSNSDYTTYAFGLSNGYRTTDVTTTNVTTPAPAVTSDCTFAFETLSSDPALSKVRITPSDDSEYFAIITLSSEANSVPRERYADDCIVYANNYDTWMTWTGEQILEATELSSDTDYTIVVFGVGEYYERNTEVFYYEMHTNRLGKVDITFDLQVTAASQSSVDYTCTPSDPDQTWAVGAVSKAKHDSFASEAEFAEYIKTAGNGCSIINTGTAKGSLMYDCEWSLFQPGEYLLYAVACYSDGWTCDILSDFTYVPFTIKERTFSDAEVSLELIVYDGDELVACDPEKYPAAQYAGKAAVDIVVTPSASCAEYYVCAQGRPASAMEGLFVDTLIGIIKSGERVAGNQPSAFGITLPWNANNNCVMAVGVDSNGIEGHPVVVSLGVDREQIVPFNPASASVSAAKLLPAVAVVPERKPMGREMLRPAIGGQLRMVEKPALEKSHDMSRTELVESRVRERIERAGGTYYTPEEREPMGEYLRIRMIPKP